MSPRPPSSPPLLDGYTYVELLGSGGFADVFKYQQLRPRREVALKVLLRGLGGNSARQFEHEANLMALLSNHPSIVSIYAAGVAPDGRPYLVMENCQPRHLGARIKSRPLSVGRALEIGIQVGGAVETAHRLGILHRDIKPANILFTEFGRPALTDFGISVADGSQSAAAFSVAWAPPEQIENRPMGPSGDVYSLAATVWAMLVGRSPFDVPGDNGSLAVTSRVKSQPAPPTGRAGVPESLERILRTALAKRPEQRYASALEFARSLQGVQAELHQSVTTIDVRDERADDDLADETETGTRVTGFMVIDPDAGAYTGPPGGSFAPAGDLTGDLTGAAPDADAAPSSVTTPATGTGTGSRTALDWIDVSDSRGTRQTDFADTSHTDPTTVSTQPVLMHGRGSLPASEPLEFTGPHVPRVPEDDTYVAPHGFTGVTDEPEPAPRRSVVPLVLGAVAAVVVVGLVIAYLVSGIGSASVGTTTPTTTARPADPIGDQVLPPTDIVGKVSGNKVVFTWKNPDPSPGDRFSYRPILVDQETQLIDTSSATATVAKQKGATCIEVEVTRANGQFSAPAKGCVE